MQEIYEKLGLFYLGKDIDKSTQEATQNLTLLKNKNFTTHTAIIGMTGSGKTGLGVGILEEAAMDNIGSIVIDPKGDMGNLALTDYTFSAENFEPWVRDEAESKGIDSFEYAQTIADRYKDGLANDFQTPQRVKKFQSIEKTIYTPGSSAGVSINILNSLDVPSDEIMQDSDIFNSYLKSTVVSLLALISQDSDATDTPQYIFLAQLITKNWLDGNSLTIESLISQIINPTFKKIGVLPLESFFPQNKRFALATKFNAIIANPSFAPWMSGEDLDIQNLLYDDNGKAKIAIFSIAHLNDQERMFFVTILLNKYIAWMRRQSGTSRLKTILYMDEIYGFFPPSKNPPSKEPMILLLKQARAFGVGIVLSTQNPVDLDYKGLSNIGTWCIGRLQTTQDIQRVIDGLSGQNNSAFNKSEIKTLLANLKKRTFFLKSAHLQDIRLFSTRWVMSYLKGPLKKQEISTLMQSKKTKKRESVTRIKKTSSSIITPIDKSIIQYFEPDSTQTNSFYPTISAKATLHFFNQKRAIDIKKEFLFQLELDKDEFNLNWEYAREIEYNFERFPQKSPKNAEFEELPGIVLKDKGLKTAAKELKNHLYHSQSLTLYRCKSAKLESSIEESKRDFLVRIKDFIQEQKEEAIDKLKERYAKKEKTLQNRLQRAQERVEKESSDRTSSFLDAGISIIGALFGKTSTTKITRAVSRGSKVLKEQKDMNRAKERLESINIDIEDLQNELEDKIDILNEKYTQEKYPIEEFKIKPRKSDIEINSCALVWMVS